MRKCASGADLDCPVVSDFVNRISGAVFNMIKRTVTEETVDLFYSFVARIVLTFSVFKKSV